MSSIKTKFLSALNFTIYSAGVVTLVLTVGFVIFYLQAIPFIKKEHEQSRQNNVDGLSSEQACINYLDKLAEQRALGPSTADR